MRVVQVIPGVYQVSFRYANITLIAGDALVLVDTGIAGSTREIVRAVESLGRSVDEISLIVLTHNHLDHVGGLPGVRKLTGAKVAAHIADVTGHLPPDPPLIIAVAASALFRPIHKYIYVRPDDIDIRLTGGEEFPSCFGLQVIHTPGHTPGSISLYLPQKKLLIVGDALSKHGGHVDPPVANVCWNLPLAMESVKKLVQLDFNTLCFGHGRPISGDARAMVQELVKSYEQ
ncbi:MAG: MBL fold metallo-hydrolase [Chloroflexota bacterium]